MSYYITPKSGTVDGYFGNYFTLPVNKHYNWDSSVYAYVLKRYNVLEPKIKN